MPGVTPGPAPRTSSSQQVGRLKALASGARVIVTMEPQQSQLFGDSNGDERMNVFTAGPADGQTSMLAADGENDGDDEDNGDDARDTDGDREDPATDSVEPVPAFTGAGVNVYRRFGAEGTD